MNQVCSNKGFDQRTWSFWETGHGKGPADGIGGLVKRTCDKAVAMGRDVTNAATFIQETKHLNNNLVLVEDHELILMAYNRLDDLEGELVAVQGTFALKCVLWKNSKETPLLIRLREQYCASCRNLLTCTHFQNTKVPSSWNLFQRKVNSILYKHIITGFSFNCFSECFHLFCEFSIFTVI